MVFCLNIKAQLTVTTTSLCIIMIIQTRVLNCENVLDLKYNRCPRNINNICDSPLNCTNRNISLVHLQCENPEKVEVLYLNNNDIDYIDNNTFRGLIKLHTLSLRNNKINKIENYVFQPLKNIKYLDLRNNIIKEIEERSFQNLNLIWRIDLEDNQLIKIKSGVFKNCDNLNQVFLTKNNIEEIMEDSFNETSKVQHFYSAYNKISDLRFLKNLPKLLFLNLSYNNIEKIPTHAFLQLKALRTLNLSYNKLKVLNSGTFSELSALENLNLSHNKIKYLGEGPFDYLHKLDHLYLGNNYLKNFSYFPIFEERNNLTLYIYINNNNWSCIFLHTIKQLRWVTLRPKDVNKNTSNIDGIPCLDQQYSDQTTSKLLTNSVNFTTTNIGFDIVTTSISNNNFNISTTTVSNNLKVTSIKQTTVTPILKIPQVPKYNTGIFSEIKINITPFIIIIVVVILLIIAVIISVTLTKRHFSRPRNNESEFYKDGYMLPARPPPKRSNFYVTLESYNSYEEVNEVDHVYEEINEQTNDSVCLNDQ